MYYKRLLEEKILQYLDRPEMIAIFGPRQVGKTTLLRQIASKVSNPIFLTFEDIETKALFEEDIKSFISLYVEPYDHIFIDEFQYAHDGGKGLKFIYDTTRGKKLFISGSSAMELSIQAIRHLVGRIFVFHLYSFSFAEYLRVKDENLSTLYDKAGLSLSSALSRQIYKHFDEYLIYGGYPRVLLSETHEEKVEVLKNLLSIYLLRDIKEIARIPDETQMYKLLKALALQIGNVVVYNELANLIGVSTPKLKEYLSIFEKAFLIKQITPFFTNKRLEIVKNPEIFFLDLGLRNAIINNFSSPEDRVDSGALLENFVLRELIEKDLKYYRTKNGAEVDFILDERIPIEVKSHLTTKKVTRSFHHFLEHYRPPVGYVLNYDQIAEEVIRGSTIRFLPHFMARKIPEL